MARALYKYTHLDSNGTTAIDAVVMCGSVTVNTRGGAGNTVRIYDGTIAESLIAVIDTTVAQGTYLYDAFIWNHLITVVMGGGAAADITVGTY